MKAQLKEFEGFRSGYKNQTGARTWVNTWAMDIWPKELESNHDLTGNMFPPCLVIKTSLIEGQLFK